jgi:hypothetical protein
MKKDGKFRHFRDKWLTPRWFRYIVMPAASGAPTALASVWFGIHAASKNAYFLRGYGIPVLFGTGVWAGLVSIIKSYLDDHAGTTIDSLIRAQEELMHLLGYVRMVVGSKSRRFFESFSTLPRAWGPAETFLAITRPDLQIKQLVQAIHGYFAIRTNPNEERLTVSLMRWNNQKNHLEYVEWFPDAAHPRSSEEHFKDATTIAGLAYFNRQIIISADVLQDSRYKRLDDVDGGSMFAYPVIDDREEKPVFIANVVSTKRGRFNEKDEPTIKIAMEVFAERLVLENRLAGIKEKAIANATRRREAARGG